MDRLDGFASNDPVFVRGHINVDASTLMNDRQGVGSVFDGERLVLEVSATIRNGTLYVEGPVVTAKLGSRERTSVEWSDFVVDSVAAPIVILGDGEITIGGICREGDGIRLVRSSELSSIRIEGAQPAKDVVNVIITMLESGPHQLTVYDLTGRTIRTVFIDGSQKKQSIMIPTEGWAHGMYLLRMITPSAESLTTTVYVEP